MKTHHQNCSGLGCDCFSHEEMIVELEHELADLRNGGDHAPWLTRDQAISEVELHLATLRAEIGTGV